MPTMDFKVGEMLHKRTLNSKTWMNFDGSYTTEVHPQAVHFVDEHGNLQNINTDLYDEADFDAVVDPVSVEGADRFTQARKEVRAAKKNNILNRAQHNFQALRVPFDVNIPRNFQRGYTIGKGVDKLTFKPVKASPSTGEVSQSDRSIITYQDVWNDTDVELKIQPDGIKETLYLKTDKAPSSFSFEVKGKEIAADFTAGALKLMPAWLIDAAGTYRDVEQKVVQSNDNKVYVELIAPVDGLVYPVEIDPTVTIAADSADWVTASYTTDGATYSQLRHGATNSRPLYGYIKFSNDIFPMNPGDEVISATLDLKIFDKIGDHTTEINRMRSYWDEPSDFAGVNSPLSLDFSSSYIREKSTAGFGVGSTIKYDIRQFVEWWFEGVYDNHGLRLATKSDSGYIAYDSITSSSPPKLTINYNSKPSRPTLTLPNGGESWNSTHTVTWGASTDLDGTPLTYEVQLSTDNGASWSTIGTGISGTSYTYDFVNKPETTMAKIRVRADDGSIYSDYDTSDGVFTIQHDHAPYPPTNLSPAGVVLDRTKTIRFTWLHSDQNPNDTQAKAEVQWRKQGTTAWNTIVINDITQYVDMAPNTLVVGEIEWRVRTTDQTGLVGAYSNPVVFNASNPTALPIIIQPDAIFSGARPVIEWSTNDQIAYQIVIEAETGGTVWDTGEIAGTVKARTAGVNLQNGINYIVKVRVKGAGGLYSAYATKTITISYTPPPKPSIVSATVDNERGSLVLEVANPEPTGTEPNVGHNNVLRRLAGETDWTRISANMEVNGFFTDYTAGGNKPYEYIVQAWGANDTFSNSDIFTVTFEIEHAQLALISDFSQFVQLEYNTSTSQAKGYNRSLTRFAGRKFPMAEFTPEETLALSTDFILKTYEDVEALYKLLDRKETLLYRDGEGRRAYVTIGGVAEDEKYFGELFGVSFQMDQVYVREEV